MGTTTTKLFGGIGEYEATAVVQKLPGCPNCHSAHPLARKPQLTTDKCPDCGFPLPPLEGPQFVKSAITLPAFLMLPARLFGQIGAWLNGLAERIDPQ